MKFKVGDKVKVTDTFLLKLPFLIDEVKDGGIIEKLNMSTATVGFYSGHTYNIYFRSLKLKLIKNQQLLLNFMD